MEESCYCRLLRYRQCIPKCYHLQDLQEHGAAGIPSQNSVDNGIGQGETSLMLLYLIYSYGLVAIPNCVNEDGGAYVDDNFFLATVDSFKQSDITLNRMLDRANEWFIAH